VGPARVLHDKHQLSKMGYGDFLVTSPYRDLANARIEKVSSLHHMDIEV
jgi:hypothetical protein